MTLKRIRTQDQNMSMIQDNVDQAISPIQQSPLVFGKTLTNVTLKSGQDNLVPHGLGRILNYWIVTRLNANSVIWEQVSSNLQNKSATDLYLNLRCSADCTVSVWVN